MQERLATLADTSEPQSCLLITHVSLVRNFVIRSLLLKEVGVAASRQRWSEDGDELQVFVISDPGSMYVAARIDMDVAGFDLDPFAVD